MTGRQQVARACRALLDGNSKFSFFEGNGISAETVKDAWIGECVASDAFTYPSLASGVDGKLVEDPEVSRVGRRR